MSVQEYECTSVRDPLGRAPWTLNIAPCTSAPALSIRNPQSAICNVYAAYCLLFLCNLQFEISDSAGSVLGNLQSSICNVYAAYCRLLSGPMQSAILNLQSEIERRSSLRVASRLTPYGEGSDSAVFAKTVRVYARTNVRDQLGSVLRTSNIAP